MLRDSTILDVALTDGMAVNYSAWVSRVQKKTNCHFTIHMKNPLQVLHVSWIRFKTLLPKTIIDRRFHKKQFEGIL